MLNQLIKKPILSCSIIFVICSVARLIEYFYIRTDKTFLSENFLHKLFGILLLWGVLSICKLRWKDIGFSPDGTVSGIGKGLLFGLVCSVFAYTVECIVLLFLHGNVHLSFYASGFSLTNEKVSQAGILLILSSVLFNLINVWMEEGIFRGLFTKILEGLSYRKSLFFIAFLFGIWHLVMPLKRLSSRRVVTRKPHRHGHRLCYLSGNDEYQMVLTLQNDRFLMVWVRRSFFQQSCFESSSCGFKF